MRTGWRKWLSVFLAVTAMALLVASLVPAADEVLHRVIVRNSSSQPVFPVSGNYHYVLAVKSPACASFIPGTTNLTLRFSSGNLSPGSTAVAEYRTTAEDLITTIYTNWTVNRAKKTIICEASPNTCGDGRTKDFVCEITDVHVIRAKNGLGTNIVAR